jgi:hypothetical protein
MQRYRADYASKDETGWLVSYAEAEATIREAGKKANEYWSRFWEKESYGACEEARKEGAEEERAKYEDWWPCPYCGQRMRADLGYVSDTLGMTCSVCSGRMTITRKAWLAFGKPESRGAAEPRCTCGEYATHESHLLYCPCRNPSEVKPLEKLKGPVYTTNDDRDYTINALVEEVNRINEKLRGKG